MTLKGFTVTASITAGVVIALAVFAKSEFFSKQTLKGKICDGRSNQPLKQVTVKIQDQQFLTGDDGCFYFEETLKRDFTS